MTIDERFARLEQYTAGLGEQRRKDREENRQLWRETQNEILSVSRKLNDLTDLFLRSQKEAEERRREIDERFRQTDERFRQTDERFRQTNERIDALVSAIGEWISRDTRQN
jgi:Mg2+ and Co2+ transporter CorA